LATALREWTGEDQRRFRNARRDAQPS
jgi:hypothetical protein